MYIFSTGYDFEKRAMRTILQECTNIIGACQNFISSILLHRDMRPAGDLMIFLLCNIHFIKEDFDLKFQLQKIAGVPIIIQLYLRRPGHHLMKIRE